MKFTYIGHACALVEHNGKRLLTDPWLEGPVYWGAWWHFPHAKFDSSIFDVDYIYISHWHFDHMHEESLKRFNKKAHLILPKFPVSGLPEPLRQMGFSQITELPNAGTYELAPGFRISIYQVQLQDDSTAVIQCDEPNGEQTTIIDLNDSKPLPSTWKRITNKFPKVDLMLRSHSPAWSYPTAYTFEDPNDAIPVSKDTYKEAFWAAADILKPKYAVAFASGVCHMTDDTLHENKNLVLAKDMLEYFVHHPLDGTRIVAPQPGATFTPKAGFEAGAALPTEADLEKFVKEERAHQHARLAEIEKQIDAKICTEQTFDTYFKNMRRRSWPLWFALKACWRFDLTSSRGTKTYWYDFNRNCTCTQEPAAARTTARFEVKEGILAEALETMCFSNIDVAKRWRVHIAKGDVTKYFLINTFSGLNEAGYSRAANLINVRLWWGLLLRRDELFDYARMALRLFIKGKDAALTSTVKTSLPKKAS
jgi:hypothetical protein